ncbi:hypothetical protein E5676_scaffold75204G00010 [Cucumis melo var. makuwa]|uniref:Uncharacterized protein n=2 Tax=Cucumis melo TaxID=3656 RepID=A0A5D3BDK5_CUCMM|nr:hypothetical protein E5676_scaffold75204G00010 [Cucumis melo var. makuwa]
MPYNQRRGGRGEQKWKEKAEVDRSPTESEAAAELTNQATPGLAHRAIWKPKAYGTTSGAAVIEGEKTPTNGTATENKGSNAGLAVQGGVVGLSQLCKSNQIEKFIVDNSAYTHEEIRATFYPKFENEKSDQELDIILPPRCFSHSPCHWLVLICVSRFPRFFNLSTNKCGCALVGIYQHLHGVSP